MRVREAMTREVFVARPDQTILEAARAMGEIDIGALPVGEDDRLVGMITDRDKRLVGILALSDLATQAGARPAAQALEGISQPGGPRSQRAA